MISRLILRTLSLFVGVFVLMFSLHEVSKLKYKFELLPVDHEEAIVDRSKIEYELPADSEINPESVFWPLKTASDMIEMRAELDPLERAKLALEHADERLVAAIELMNSGDYESGLVLLQKSERYLEVAAEDSVIASESGVNVIEFMSEIAQASLKHREVIEQSLILAPEDARPLIVQTMDNTKAVFLEMKNKLFEMGETAPINPFESS